MCTSDYIQGKLGHWLGVTGIFFFSSRRRHTISLCDWSSDVYSSDLRSDTTVRVDDSALFREAARNHQLERSYHSERRARRSKRRDAERERRAALATAFLADLKQREIGRASCREGV